MARLRAADPSMPGITRRRRGRSFEYADARGRPISKPAVLERIEALRIPPAWKDVWICPHATGHIQATGTDAAGRRQYLYHPAWRERRDREKFERMLDFAQALPGLRRTVAAHLVLRGMPRERVLACAARMLDRGFFRIGSEEYADENETFGLATLQKRHARLGPGGVVVFDYPAKGGKRRVQRLVDPEVAAVVRALKRRRNGTELLAYKRGGRWADVRSVDVNAYIKETTGGDHSAKDFRTWHATVLAAIAVAALGNGAGSREARERVVALAVKEVAHYLGNTPAVCRSSYIDPRVFERYRKGASVPVGLDDLAAFEAGAEAELQTAAERAVLALLAGA